MTSRTRLGIPVAPIALRNDCRVQLCRYERLEVGKAHESIPIGLWVSHSIANKITLHMYEHVNESKAGSLFDCARSIAESKRTKEHKERHVLKNFKNPFHFGAGTYIEPRNCSHMQNGYAVRLMTCLQINLGVLAIGIALQHLLDKGWHIHPCIALACTWEWQGDWSACPESQSKLGA